MVFRRAIALLLLVSPLSAEIYYEGTATFRGYGHVDLNWMVQLLPYNPVIIEVGAYCGKETVYATKVWPKSRRIIAFEPNPRAFHQLQQAVKEIDFPAIEIFNAAISSYNGTATLYVSDTPDLEPESALLPPIQKLNGHQLKVPCVVLDDWCAQNQVDEVDILRLETEGLELSILQSSTNILKNTKIIIVSSFFRPYREDTVNYFALKDFLTKAQFVPLAHWYTAGERGCAVYVSQELYDAYFIRCLGLGLGGLLYP